MCHNYGTDEGMDPNEYSVPSRKHLRMKVTLSLHLKHSKTGENHGLVLNRFFSIFLHNIMLLWVLEAPSAGERIPTEYPQHMILWRTDGIKHTIITVES